MNTKEVTQYLEALGWSTRKDEVGDRCATFALADRQVELIYSIDRINELQKFGAMLSVTTDAFSSACSNIIGERLNSHPLTTAWRGIDVRAPEISEHHIREATRDAISWSKDQDLNKALSEHAALPTSAPGIRPVWHLAALVLLGDDVRLKAYQTSFEKGDRLGFVPYVTREYIDRSVALVAQQ